MRILVLFNQDVYALKALNILLPALQGHRLLLGHSSRVGSAKREPARALRALSQVENALFNTLNQRDSGRIKGLVSLTHVIGCRDISLDDINTPRGLAELAGFAPDLLLSIRFGKILKAPALAIPKYGAINLHSGLLPDYRGVMPTFWAMLHEESKIGTTLHWIPDATIDTGPTIQHTMRQRDPGQSYLQQVWSLYDEGIEGMIATVRHIERGALTATSTTPTPTAGNYYSYPTEHDLTAFSATGQRLFTADDREQLLAE